MRIVRGKGMTELALAFIALALALRVVIAPGFMATATPAGKIVVTLCSGNGPIEMSLPGKSTPAHQSHDPCPYAAIGTPPLAPQPPLLAALPLPPVPPTVAPNPAEDRPHIGAAAPPPRPTGPPALA
ncbi:MAG TPA: hypothetical protein VNZ43_12000 [Sphingomonadaceae bacterium]|jgi:hypothetical protein|nr:hypothetical protein [Sphingomonadaceae bacterium]